LSPCFAKRGIEPVKVGAVVLQLHRRFLRFPEVSLLTAPKAGLAQPPPDGVQENEVSV